MIRVGQGMSLEEQRHKMFKVQCSGFKRFELDFGP